MWMWVWTKEHNSPAYIVEHLHRKTIDQEDWTEDEDSNDKADKDKEALFPNQLS